MTDDPEQIRDDRLLLPLWRGFCDPCPDASRLLQTRARPSGCACCSHRPPQGHRQNAVRRGASGGGLVGIGCPQARMTRPDARRPVPGLTSVL